MEIRGKPSAFELWLVDLAASAAAVFACWCAATAAGSPRRDVAAENSWPLAHLLPPAQTPSGWPDGNGAPIGADQHRTVAHAALRLLLSRHAGADAAFRPFEVSRAGRPSLTGSGVDFSLSHSGGYALVGIAPALGGRIGVDIELVRRRVASDRLRQRLTAYALLLGGTLRSQDPERRLLEAWVAIEAVAKARGDGVGRLLNDLRSRAPAASPAFHGRPAGLHEFNAEFRIRSVPMPAWAPLVAACAISPQGVACGHDDALALPVVVLPVTPAELADLLPRRARPRELDQAASALPDSLGSALRGAGAVASCATPWLGSLRSPQFGRCCDAP